MSYKTDFMLDAFSARIAALEDEVKMLQVNVKAVSHLDGRITVPDSKGLPDVTRTYTPQNTPLMQHTLAQAQAQNIGPGASQAQMTYNQRNPAFANTVWADYPQR